MKSDQQKSKPTPKEQKQQDSARQRTNLPGQNPKQNDAPHHDEHHDENRVNPLDKSSEPKPR